MEEPRCTSPAILKIKGRKVVTTTADKSLLDVAKLLEQQDIGCIVIEGDDGQVAGIVSERDLVRAIGKSGAKVLKEPVSVYMTKTVVTAREADTIDRLMSEMTVHRFRLQHPEWDDSPARSLGAVSCATAPPGLPGFSRRRI